MVLVIIVILLVLYIACCQHHHSRYVDLGNGISCKINRNEYATGGPPLISPAAMAAAKALNSKQPTGPASYKFPDRSTSHMVSQSDPTEYNQMIVNSDSANITTDSSDYNQYMIQTGLESSVLTSHRTFTDDLQNTTTGASASTEFSHDDDEVVKWGLRRTSPYIPESINSRTVGSLTDSQRQINASGANPIAQALFG